MELIQKPCIFCDGLINEEAITCKHCSKDQIGLIEAKEDFKKSAYFRWLPFLFVPFFVLTLLFIIPLVYLPDPTNMKLWLLAFFLWFFLSTNDTLLKPLIRTIHLNQLFGIKYWFVKPFQELYYKVKERSLFKKRFISLGYEINPPIVKLVEETLKNKRKAKTNWVISSFLIFISSFLILVAIVESPTDQDFSNHLKDNSSVKVLATKEIMDAGYLKIFAVTKEMTEQNKNLEVKTILYFAILNKYLTHDIGINDTISKRQKTKESLNILNNLKVELYKNPKTFDKFEPKKDIELSKPKTDRKLRDILVDVIF